MNDTDEHPLHALERCARAYDAAVRQCRCHDSRSVNADYSVRAMYAQKAAVSRALVLSRSDALQRAALVFADWAASQAARQHAAKALTGESENANYSSDMEDDS